MILGFNVFSVFILFTLIYVKFYINFCFKLTYYISCFSLWLFNCFYLCQVFKIAWVTNHKSSASTSKFIDLIDLFSTKSLQLTKFKVKCCRHFISLEFSELIREKHDEFLSFMLHALIHNSLIH